MALIEKLIFLSFTKNELLGEENTSLFCLAFSGVTYPEDCLSTYELETKRGQGDQIIEEKGPKKRKNVRGEE